MEQNNNNDKGAVETIKQTAKNEVNKQKNKLLGKILIKIAPYIGLFLLCLFAIGLIMTSVFLIIEIFKGLLGINANAAASTLEESQKMISITSNGYELKDDYGDKIIKILQGQNTDIDLGGFFNDGLSDMIDKYIEAEIKTMYPAIGKGEVDGAVEIWRMSAETGETKQLSYIGYDDFDKMVKNGNRDVLNKFSLNPENFKLCIAVTETVIHYDYDESKNNNIGNKQIVSTTIKSKEFEYQTSLQPYATPLNYFIAMHMVTGDKDFMNELVDMVNSKTDIELTFLETTSKNFIKVDYEGEIINTSYVTEEVQVPIDNDTEESTDNIEQENAGTLKDALENTLQNSGDKTLNEITDELAKENEDNATQEIESQVTTILRTSTWENKTIINPGNINEFSQYIEPKQYIIETVYTAGTLPVTKANTWRVQSKLNIQKNEPMNSPIQENNMIEIKIDESDRLVTDRVSSGSYNVGYIKEITNEWTESYSITTNETEAGYELSEFMKLIESYPKVKNNLESSPSLLFYLLEENENTQELASVMKYVIYQLSGIDYGVTELDFSEYLKIQFSRIGKGTSIFLEYMHSWENTAVWLYLQEQTQYSDYLSNYITQDKTKYVCYDDGATSTGTKNFGFGVCHYYSGKYNNQDRYQELGIDITQYDVGSTLDVEIVDKVKQMYLNDSRKYIENKLNNAGITLEEHQIHALMAVCYQWGNSAINSFITAYKQYGDTDELRQNFIHSEDKPFLTGNGGSSREVQRANANWTLFHEGKYLAGDGTELDPNDFTAGEFLAIAEEIWNEVCTSGNFTTYGGASIPCTGPSIDCSAYASWIIYEYGYTEFKGWQKNTQVFYETDWNKKYGWEEISVGSRENPYDILQPGDLFVRWESGGTHHITLIVEKSDGKIYCYDCGNSDNWIGNSGEPVNCSYFLTESGPGKIIRVTQP